MKNVNQWPLWLQLIVAIPNAIVMIILLWIWWPKNNEELRRYRVVTIPYLILVFLFYMFFVR